MKNYRWLIIEWIRKDSNSWIYQNFGDKFIKIPNFQIFKKIETIAERTNKLGLQPLWEGYEQLTEYKYKDTMRTSNQVRTGLLMGSFYSHLVSKRKPGIIIEFGTAFGVSGMYWLAGLESNGDGKLLTFEPNGVWAKIARENLSEISNRFQLTVGTFEENIDNSLPDGKLIDIAFIDAIHTSDFVFQQFEIVKKHLSKKGIVLFDDIDFSDDMRACWKKIADDERVKASAVLSQRVGIIEL